jgi:hypothetical protein
MPLHPTSACYAHIIESGLKNVRRLTAAGDTGQVSVELEHLDAVTGLLTDYLLYDRSDPRFDPKQHERYWRTVRPAYLAKASPQSLQAMFVAWDFFARSQGFTPPGEE